MTCSLIHHGANRCDGCGRTLKGRQSRWCSRRCQAAYTANHRWTQAKAVAKAAVRITLYSCAHCGELVDKVEVNHIEPCKGKHGVWGCWHHQSNLEVLCVPCHRKVTAQQRKEGKLK